MVIRRALPSLSGQSIASPARAGRRPEFYEYRPSLAFTGPLAPAEHPGTVRVLGVDGIEVQAAEAGSVTVAIDGQRIDSMDQVINVVNRAKPGDTLDITVRRAGGTRTITVTLADRPSSAGGSSLGR